MPVDIATHQHHTETCGCRFTKACAREREAGCVVGRQTGFGVFISSRWGESWQCICVGRKRWKGGWRALRRLLGVARCCCWCAAALRHRGCGLHCRRVGERRCRRVSVTESRLDGDGQEVRLFSKFLVRQLTAVRRRHSVRRRGCSRSFWSQTDSRHGCSVTDEESADEHH